MTRATPRRPAAPAGTAGLLPLGALAAGFGLALPPAFAQTAAAPAAPAASAPAPKEATLPPIAVKAAAEPSGKDSYQATQTSIGKGTQELRDIPQSITVVTERLIDDRNLDTLKQALHQTAGISFLAAEGGEEDIRLRGFSLATTGDIFVDGLRDPAFYDRDTFNNDRIEVLRGSASMLFGRGSTGGAVNQASKQPLLLDQREVEATAGSDGAMRLTGDFNVKTGENAAFRLNVMRHTADGDGSLKLDKLGIAPSFRWGIGTADEFSAGLYHLDNRNGIHYGLPWLRRSATSEVRVLIPDRTLRDYYGLASDYSNGSATYGTLSHIHRFGSGGGELKTTLRQGRYERDQRSGAIRFVSNDNPANGPIVEPPNLDTISADTALRRGTNNKVQDLETRTLQSDYSGRFGWFGLNHELLGGIDLAREDFVNYTLNPGGQSTDPRFVKPNTTIGTPNDGATVAEKQRESTPGRTFAARALGLYVQDLVQIAPAWKLLAGLRFDRFEGRYWAAATTNPQGQVTPEASRQRSDSLWSKRFGVLYQPTPRQSYHVSYGTSFNTSGDTYQYDDQSVNTPPESSGNFEIGAKLDSADQRFTTRLALFHSTKYHERNRDPDSAATQALLSGKRHSAGFELDITGRLTPQWEVYGSYAFVPVAKIDVGAPGSTPGVGEGAGTRSSLTPRHSGTVWTTYRLTPAWRIGGGLNARGAQTPNRNPAGVVAPAFVTADLMAEVMLNPQLTLKLNVTNLSDKLYADALYTGHYIPGTPRTVQLTAAAKF